MGGSEAFDPAVRADSYRAAVVGALVATTAANVAFFGVDPRMAALSPALAVAFSVGAAAYAAAIPLCLKRRGEGFALALVMGVLGAGLAIADNFSASGSSPNPATFALNGIVLALQIPLIAASARWLRAARRPETARASS